jgi:large subunit ribosomal protein L32
MANPKRRHSKARTAKRRAHDSIDVVGLGKCPHCHEPKRPHVVCSHCGYYKGRQIRAVKEA